MTGLPPAPRRSMSESPHSTLSSRTEFPQSGYHILVYRNGDAHDHGTIVFVTRAQFRHWLYFLDFLTGRTKSKVAINKLYTVDGKKEIRHFRQLENEQSYVAAGSVFNPVQYGSIQHPTWKKSRVINHSHITGINSAETNLMYLRKRGFKPILHDMWDVSSFDLKGKVDVPHSNPNPSDYPNVSQHKVGEHHALHHRHHEHDYKPPANLKQMNLSHSLNNSFKHHSSNFGGSQHHIRPRSGTGPKEQHHQHSYHTGAAHTHTGSHTNVPHLQHTDTSHTHHLTGSVVATEPQRKNSFVANPPTKHPEGHSSHGHMHSAKPKNKMVQFMPVKQFYNLIYFAGVRGRAEPIRQILHFANKQFEEKLLSFEQWPTLKHQMPMEQLPVLVFADGRFLCQSYAIARYLAREHGLMGDNNLQSAMIDMLMLRMKDIYNGFYKVLLAKDEKAKQEEFLFYRRERLDVFLDRYDIILDNNGNNWFVGDKISWVDLAVAELVGNLRDYWDPQILKDFPSLNAHIGRVRNYPQLKKYIDSRPHPAMNF